MDKKTLMWIVIGALFLAVLFLTFKAAAITNTVTGNAIDTTGWTDNEIMNYEMHGTIPSRLAGSSSAAQSSGSQMVGGC